jgi:aminopeptidase N
VQILAAALPVEDQDVAIIRLGAWAEQELLGRFVPESPLLRAQVASALVTRMETAEPGSGVQLAAARAWAKLSHDTDCLTRWHAGGTPAGLALDADMRWAVVRQLARLGALTADDLEVEAQRDRTAPGAVHAARCRASLPDPMAKGAIWHRIVHDRDASNYEVFAWCEGFWYAEQDQLLEPYAQRFFTEMPGTAAFRAGLVSSTAAKVGFPRYSVDRATLLAAQACLERDDLTAGLRRSIQDGTDDLRSALAVREHA